MKCVHWLLIGLTVLCLTTLLSGCVSKSRYEALQADYDASQADSEALQADYETLGQQNSNLSAQLQQAQSDLAQLQADHDAVSQELADIRKVYPPRDFSSLWELQNWLWANDVSESPMTMTVEAWYSKALRIQEDALKDGYIISVDYDYDAYSDLVWVWCVTIISGDIWYWDPETDEPLQDPHIGRVK